MSAATEERTGPKAVPDPESDAEAVEAMGGDPAPANGAGPEDPPVDDPDMEGANPDEQAEPELVIEGDGQLGLKIGGRKPEKATIKLRGGSIHLNKGQIEKGDTLNLLVKVTCAEVHLVDKRDNTTGEIVETERRQILKITGVERVGGG